MNSELVHTWISELVSAGNDIGVPGLPNSTGITTVKPAATTSSPNAMTSGVIPGSSWITMTPGPEPFV